MNLFYSNKITPENIAFDTAELQHLKVMRAEVGDTINVMDGKGNLYETQLLTIDKKLAIAKIINKENPDNDKPYQLHLAIAPTKSNDRIEFLLEKAIELGVDEISFLKTERTEKKFLKPERMHKVLLAACKQSICLNFPILNFDVPFKNIVEMESSNKFICHCLDQDKKISLKEQKEGNFLILIGPEGDFSPKEIEIATKAGFQSLDLGKSRLRTETAGIYVCAALRNNNSL